MWRGFLQMTRTTPCRRITRQDSQRRLTEGLTFMVKVVGGLGGVVGEVADDALRFLQFDIGFGLGTLPFNDLEKSSRP